MFSNFFSENRAVWDKVENYGGAREAVENISDARCMLDKATRAIENARSRAPPPIHTHAQACTHTHRNV
jgi:hypothetical protein